MKSKKTLIIKITIVIIDIIALLVIGLKYYSYLDKNNNNDENTNITYNYKIFEYSVPSNLLFNKIDDKKFQIKSNDWTANIEIYIDEYKSMYYYSDVIYSILSADDSTIMAPEEIMIKDSKIIIYNKPSAQSVLCYVSSTIWPYAYEIELFNNDKSYSTTALNTIVDIINTNIKVKENEIDNTYDIIDINKLEKLKKQLN